jgi:hypothetical protein
MEKQAEIIAEQAEMAAKQAQQAASAGIPVPPAPPAPPATGKILNTGPGQGLQRLVYPNSTVEGETNFEGNQVIQIRAKAQISDIERFYTQKLGAPPALRKTDKLIFDIKNKAEKLVVVVKQDLAVSGEYLIQVIRTP